MGVKGSYKSQSITNAWKPVWKVWMVNSLGYTVSSEFTSGNCAKTLKKPALHCQFGEAGVQGVSLDFLFLPTAGRRAQWWSQTVLKGLCYIRSLTSSRNICSSPAHTFWGWVLHCQRRELPHSPDVPCTSLLPSPHLPPSLLLLLLFPHLQFLYCSLSQRYSCPAERLTGMLCTSVILPPPPPPLSQPRTPHPSVPAEKVCSTCSHHPPWAICLSE